MITNSNQSMIKLKNVTKSDIHFLFELLEKRTSFENISHEKMPAFKNHEKFINSKPYFKWYIIYENSEKIGSIYLTNQDEIGIHFLDIKNHEKLFLKLLERMMKKHPRERFLININPKNKKSIRFFKNNGFKLIQYTFELSKIKN